MIGHGGEHACLWCGIMNSRGGRPVAHRTCEGNTCCVPGCDELCPCDHSAETHFRCQISLSRKLDLALPPAGTTPGLLQTFRRHSWLKRPGDSRRATGRR